MNIPTFKECTESQRQEMANMLVSRNTFYGMTTEVEYILNKSIESIECYESPFSHDDIENNDPTCRVQINGEYIELDQEGLDNKIEFYDYLVEKVTDLISCCIEDNGLSDNPQLTQNRLESKMDKFQDTLDTLQNAECDTYPEIMQWFLCPNVTWMLKEKGEVVLTNEYWGRCTSDQSITLDRCIQEIAHDMYAHEYFTKAQEQKELE